MNTVANHEKTVFAEQERKTMQNRTPYRLTALAAALVGVFGLAGCVPDQGETGNTADSGEVTGEPASMTVGAAFTSDDSDDEASGSNIDSTTETLTVFVAPVSGSGDNLTWDWSRKKQVTLNADTPEEVITGLVSGQRYGVGVYAGLANTDDNWHNNGIWMEGLDTDVVLDPGSNTVTTRLIRGEWTLANGLTLNKTGPAATVDGLLVHQFDRYFDDFGETPPSAPFYNDNAHYRVIWKGSDIADLRQPGRTATVNGNQLALSNHPAHYPNRFRDGSSYNGLYDGAVRLRNADNGDIRFAAIAGHNPGDTDDTGKFDTSVTGATAVDGTILEGVVTDGRGIPATNRLRAALNNYTDGTNGDGCYQDVPVPDPYGVGDTSVSYTATLCPHTFSASAADLDTDEALAVYNDAPGETLAHFRSQAEEVANSDADADVADAKTMVGELRDIAFHLGAVDQVLEDDPDRSTYSDLDGDYTTGDDSPFHATVPDAVDAELKTPVDNLTANLSSAGTTLNTSLDAYATAFDADFNPVDETTGEIVDPEVMKAIEDRFSAVDAHIDTLAAGESGTTESAYGDSITVEMNDYADDPSPARVAISNSGGPDGETANIDITFNWDSNGDFLGINDISGQSITGPGYELNLVDMGLDVATGDMRIDTNGYLEQGASRMEGDIDLTFELEDTIEQFKSVALTVNGETKTGEQSDGTYQYTMDGTLELADQSASFNGSYTDTGQDVSYTGTIAASDAPIIEAVRYGEKSNYALWESYSNYEVPHAFTNASGDVELSATGEFEDDGSGNAQSAIITTNQGNTVGLSRTCENWSNCSDWAVDPTVGTVDSTVDWNVEPLSNRIVEASYDSNAVVVEEYTTVSSGLQTDNTATVHWAWWMRSPGLNDRGYGFASDANNTFVEVDLDQTDCSYWDTRDLSGCTIDTTATAPSVTGIENQGTFASLGGAVMTLEGNASVGDTSLSGGLRIGVVERGDERFTRITTDGGSEDTLFTLTDGNSTLEAARLNVTVAEDSATHITRSRMLLEDLTFNLKDANGNEAMSFAGESLRARAVEDGSSDVVPYPESGIAFVGEFSVPSQSLVFTGDFHGTETVTWDESASEETMDHYVRMRGELAWSDKRPIGLAGQMGEVITSSWNSDVGATEENAEGSGAFMITRGDTDPYRVGVAVDTEWTEYPDCWENCPEGSDTFTLTAGDSNGVRLVQGDPVVTLENRDQASLAEIDTEASTITYSDETVESVF